MSEQRPIGADRTLDYAQRPPRISGLAIVALVFGIVALATALLAGLGCLFAPVAVLLGFLALWAVHKSPQRLKGRGIAWIAVLMGCAAVPVAIGCLMYLVAQGREMGNRALCAANLRLLAVALEDYASANGGAFPVLPFAPYGSANAGTSTRTLTSNATTSLQELYAKPAAQAGSPLTSVWILAIDGRVNSQAFYCPSMKIPSSNLTLTAPGGDFFASIQADDQIGYSFAYPYTETGAVGDWWKSTADAALPLAADIAPLAETGKPKRNPAGTGSVANSDNHARVGQNVAFADSHVEFDLKPQVGHANDNIYTLSGTATPDPAGNQPTLGPISGHGGTPGAFDIIMVPARNLDTGKLW